MSWTILRFMSSEPLQTESIQAESFQAESFQASQLQQSAPVAPKARLEQIDILRGIALLGILVVNMLSFSGPYLEVPSLSFWSSFPDKVAEFLIIIFAEGAFYSIFSFLFGIGFALQILSAEAKGELALKSFGARFRRRLFFLFIFGLIHIFLIWEGDILTQYAITGFVLLLFRNRSLAQIRRWIIGCIIVSLSFFALTGPFIVGDGADVQEVIELMGSGSYVDILIDRAGYAVATVFGSLFLIPTILWLFLVGLVAGKTRFFHELEHKGPFLRRTLSILLPLALIAKGILAYLLITNPAGSWNFVFSWGLGGPLLGFSYIAILLLIMQRPLGLKRLSVLAPVGRMALTNYISHSLICTTLFYGYGFALYAQLGPAITALIAIVIFVAQIALSNWWLSRFRFGPLEWLWRSLTYGKWINLTKIQ